MTRIAVNGAMGRMGTRILELAAASAQFEIAGAFEHEAGGHRGKTIKTAAGKELKIQALAEDALGGNGVLIDFSSPEGIPVAVEAAQKAGWGLVVGTTGAPAQASEMIRAASEKIPVVYSANMSVGVNLVLELVRIAASKLGKDFDIEITEAHHRHKKDAPSGTALLLADAILDAKGWDRKALNYRQEGKSPSERPEREIGIQVVRAGEIVGDHTVLFGGPAETIEIIHRAQSRDTFARGALLAASFLSQKQAGLYTMGDVLK